MENHENSYPPPEQVLEVVTTAGHILLENGAEIFRVEETMRRISEYFGVSHEHFFVLSNGIFTTGDNIYAKVEHIPVRGTRLDRVVEVNQLSREVEAGKYTLEQVAERLEEIRVMPEKVWWKQVLASGVGSASFCYLFGGGFEDCIAAFIAGVILYLFILGVFGPRLSKITRSLAGGSLVTVICIISYRLGLGDSLNHMVIGSVIPLVPGVPFTNGIRDIADEDYISGSVRLLDAMMSFLCIAIGVGMTFTVYRDFFGGNLL